MEYALPFSRNIKVRGRVRHITSVDASHFIYFIQMTVTSSKKSNEGQCAKFNRVAGEYLRLFPN